MFAVTVKGKQYYVDVTDTSAHIDHVKPRLDTEADDLPDFDTVESSAQENTAVRAVMPGTVSQVLTKKGDHVSIGDVLLLMEAMKMELEIRAEQAGTVYAVLVGEGDRVQQGQALIQLK